MNNGAAPVVPICNDYDDIGTGRKKKRTYRHDGAQTARSATGPVSSIKPPPPNPFEGKQTYADLHGNTRIRVSLHDKGRLIGTRSYDDGSAVQPSYRPPPLSEVLNQRRIRPSAEPESCMALLSDAPSTGPDSLLSALNIPPAALNPVLGQRPRRPRKVKPIPHYMKSVTKELRQKFHKHCHQQDEHVDFVPLAHFHAHVSHKYNYKGSYY